MRSPRGAVHQYQYTPQGRLIRDKNPGRGGWTLTRTPPAMAGGYTVDMTTDGGRTARYAVNADKFATERTHAITHADGTASLSTFKNGETVETRSDGSTTTVFDNPDPRFGIRAPISDVIHQTPAGLRREERTARSVTLSVPSDPTSLQAWSETHTLNGAMSSVSFNVSTRTLTGRSFASHTQSLVFDAQGYPVELQRPALHPVTMSYDGPGRLEAIRQSTRETLLGYDPQGRLASIRDPALRTTRWGRDSAGRVTSIERPDLQLILLGRDAHGNVTSVTPPSRPAHAMSYTLNDVEESYTPPLVSPVGLNGGATIYHYDTDDLLTGIERPDGLFVSIGRDAAGRVETIDDNAGTRSFGYAPTTGQLVSASDPSGVALGFFYDGPLLTETLYAGLVSGSVRHDYDNRFMTTTHWVNDEAISYTIDNDGFVTRAGGLVASWRSDNGLLISVTLGAGSTSFSHNAFGEREREQTFHISTLVYEEAYTRDLLGRIETRIRKDASGTRQLGYTYDALGRLRQVTENSALTEDYVYDDNGNRISSTVRGQSRAATYDAQDRLLTLGDTSCSYNDYGDLVQKTTPGGVTRFTYDGLGNLRSAVLPSGNNIVYAIDAMNRRVGRWVFAGSAPVSQQGFLYDGALRIVAELDAGNNVVSRFVYATRPTTPEYMIRGGATYRIVTDHVGSPVLVLDAATGAVMQRMRYDSFGVVLEDTNPGFQPFGFAGGLYDRDTALVRFGARDYDPETGRWTGKDPIGFGAGDTNLYGYAINDPINFIDSDGLDSAAAGLALEAAEVVAEAAAVSAGAVAAAVAAALAVTFYPSDIADDDFPATPDQLLEPNGSPTDDTTLEPEAGRKKWEKNKPGRKKQGREPGEKKRQKPGSKPRNPPKEPKKHTPGKEHRKERRNQCE